MLHGNTLLCSDLYVRQPHIRPWSVSVKLNEGQSPGRLSKSDFTSNLFKRFQRPMNVLMRVRRHERDAQTGSPRRYRRRPDSLGEDPLFEQPLREGHAFLRVADDERLDLALAPAQGKPRSLQTVPQRPAIMPEREPAL